MHLLFVRIVKRVEITQIRLSFQPVWSWIPFRDALTVSCFAELAVSMKCWLFFLFLTFLQVIFLIFILSVAATWERENDLKICYEGIFMKNTAKVENAKLRVKKAKGCIMSIVYHFKEQKLMTNSYGKQVQIPICLSATGYGEVLAVEESQLHPEFWKLITPKYEELRSGLMEYEDKSELENDRGIQLSVKTAKSKSNRTTVSYMDITEKSLLVGRHYFY